MVTRVQSMCLSFPTSSDCPLEALRHVDEWPVAGGHLLQENRSKVIIAKGCFGKILDVAREVCVCLFPLIKSNNDTQQAS
jgi:hypothetical protein